MALLGANVQCNGYFPGYYSTRDLIFDTEGSTWTSSNVNNEQRTDCYRMGSLPVSSPCTLLGYNKELLKQTILKHDAIFRDQIHELHRVYHKQRELMDEIKRNGKHNLRLEASWSSSTLSSKNSRRICSSPNLPWSTAQSSVLIAESVHSAQGKSRQTCPAPASSIMEESLGDYKPPEFKYRKIGKKILDLQLTADEYIDSEGGEENERVNEVPQDTVYSINGISQVVCNSHDKQHGTNSKGFTDLNIPFKLEEEAATKSCDLGPHTYYRNNPFYDMSRRTKNLPSNVIQNLNKREDLEALSDNLLPNREKKHEWAYLDNNAGQSGDLLEQFNDLPHFRSLHKQGEWTERKFSTSESSTLTQGPISNSLLGPSTASRTCAPHQLVSGADISSEIPPLGLRETPVSVFGQKPLVVHVSSASLSQSSKSLMGISGFTRDELYQGTSVKPVPNLDGQNFLLNCYSSSSKLLDRPSVSTNDPNNCDNHVSLDSHELRRHVEGSKDARHSKKLNLNIMPAGHSDLTASQSIQITHDNRFQDSTRRLPWLKEKLVGKGKPNGENEISSQIESSLLNHYNTGGILGLKQSPAGEHLMKNVQKKHESLAGIIDLNSSMIEDENMPMDVDFNAPASPENKESSPPRGESDENPLEVPFKLSEQEEQIKIAAQALVSISGFMAHKDLQVATYSSESFASNPLRWFAGIVSTPVNHPENETKVDFNGNANDLVEFLPSEMDYFEFMTLKLTETKVQDSCCKTVDQFEQVVGSSSTTQPRKGSRTNRGRWRKDFQSEILPSLASLSRYEVTEDLQTIGGLVAASTHSETGSLRNVLVRGRRRSSTSTSNITDMLLNLKQITKLGIDKRGLISWGKTCRKRRGQRLPSTNPRFILSQVYN